MSFVLINQLLSTNGDGTGTTNAAGDYSSAATEFSYDAPAGERHQIHRIIVTLEDEAGMAASDYANGGALTNGISLVWERSGATLVDFTPEAVKTNSQWARYCYDVDVKTWSNGPELLTARWTFAKSGKPIDLDGNTSDRLVVTLNDNFGAGGVDLTSQYFLVQGYYTTGGRL